MARRSTNLLTWWASEVRLSTKIWLRSRIHQLYCGRQGVDGLSKMEAFVSSLRLKRWRARSASTTWMRNCKEVELHPMEVVFNSEMINDSFGILGANKGWCHWKHHAQLGHPEKALLAWCGWVEVKKQSTCLEETGWSERKSVSRDKCCLKVVWVGS